jgi:UrcA family protein
VGNTEPEELEMNSKALLITAVALCLTAGAARADSRPSMRVRTGDLDLSSARDVQRLYERIYQAAITVCGGGPLVFFVAGPPQQYLTCRDATLDGALGQFDAPRVVDLRARLKARPWMAPVMR